MMNSKLVKELDGMLDKFFAEYSTPAYNLWDHGVAKGTTPKPGMWIKRNPLPWLKTYWQDFVSKPPSPAAFSESDP
jgi:hypothetical protein